MPLRLSDYGVTTEEAVHAAADELIKTFNHIALSKHSNRIGYSKSLATVRSLWYA